MKTVRFIALACLLACPVPMVIGLFGFSTYSVLLMIVLSSNVPFILKKNKKIKEALKIDITKISLVHANLIWAAFFLSGAGMIIKLNIPSTAIYMKALVMLVCYALYQTLIIITAKCLTAFFGRNKNKDKLLTICSDLVMMIFPIPIAAVAGLTLGMLFSDFIVRAQFPVMVYITIIINIYFVLTLGSIVFYLYPKDENKHKAIRIIRIIITAFLWAGMNIYFDLGSNVYMGMVSTIGNTTLAILALPIYHIVILILPVVIGYYFEEKVLERTQRNITLS